MKSLLDWRRHRDVAGTSMLIVIVMIMGLFAFNGLTGCGLLKAAAPIVKTMDDIATDLCMFAASEQEQEALAGLSPADFCRVKDHLQPFIDEALAAKRAAGQAAGFGRGVPPADAGAD